MTFAQSANNPSTTLVPIGVGLGLRISGDEVAGVVRRGGICHTMDESLYSVWRHALPSVTEAEPDGPAADDLSTAGEEIDWLLTRGLLVPLADEVEAALPMLERHRMIPIGIGLGNSASTPGSFAIGNRDLQPLVHVDALTYGVWCVSDQQRSILDCCRLVAEETAITPSEVAAAVLRRLPGLLAAIVACLDTGDQTTRPSRTRRDPGVLAS